MNTRRIVILGFMACGKTTVGEELARQLNCGFVDLDSFISSREGRSPAEIITQDGQAAFRELETLALRDVLQDRQAHVIALGGGTWLKAANRTMVALFDCITVWLDTPFEICWERISNSATVRPLAPNLETRANVLTSGVTFMLWPNGGSKWKPRTAQNASSKNFLEKRNSFGRSSCGCVFTIAS